MRKHLHSSARAATAGLLSISLLLTALEATSAPENRPNILFILADDQSPQQ